MEIGRKIVKKIIVILEGCVVKLKELESYLAEKSNDESLNHSDGQHTNSLNNALGKTEKHHDESDYYNISMLDQYMKNVGLPTGSNFMKLIQRVELTTEYNVCEVLLSSLSNMDDFYSFFESLNDNNFVKFEYFEPSPIRREENGMVNIQFITKELSEVGLMYDNNKSLYDNSLRIIEEKQKKVMESIVLRFQDTVEKIKSEKDELAKEKTINILRNELNNRMSILRIKTQRN